MCTEGDEHSITIGNVGVERKEKNILRLFISKFNVLCYIFERGGRGVFF